MDAAAHCTFKAAIRRWRCDDSELSSLPEVTGISSVGSISNAALLKLELLQQPREVQRLLPAASTRQMLAENEKLLFQDADFTLSHDDSLT